MVSITTNDLRALLAHDSMTEPDQVCALIETARAASQRSVWSAYSEIVTRTSSPLWPTNRRRRSFGAFQPMIALDGA